MEVGVVPLGNGIVRQNFGAGSQEEERKKNQQPWGEQTRVKLDSMHQIRCQYLPFSETRVVFVFFSPAGLKGNNFTGHTLSHVFFFFQGATSAKGGTSFEASADPPISREVTSWRRDRFFPRGSPGELGSRGEAGSRRNSDITSTCASFLLCFFEETFALRF